MSVEIRRDYMIDRYVVFAPTRSRRPSDFKVASATEHESARCPFCAGKEDETPPANYLLIKEGGSYIEAKDEVGKPRLTGWSVRVIPNLYPAFSTEVGALTAPPKGIPPPEQAYGYHEVIVESPVHDQHFWLAPEEQRQLVLRAIMNRIEFFSRDKRISAIVPFRNHGRDAGASLSHAHTQIVASAHLPPVLDGEDRSFSRGFSLLSLAESESESPRSVYSNSKFFAFAMWAGTTPYSFMIVPKEQAPSPLNADISALSDVLSKTLRALAVTLNDPPFNLVWHIAPLPWSAHQLFHWHLEVYPKLSVWAGYEIGSGTYINVVTPEEAAKYLRQAAQKL
ncbi:MAG: galactose-1-phosphate uridylyltransferase [Thermoprotei archaeon]